MVARRPIRLLLTLGTVAAVLVVGGISAASLLNRRSPVAPQADQEQPVVTAPVPGDEPVPAPGNAGWSAVANPTALLTYEVPPGWEVADEAESLTTSNGIRLRHLADWGRYTCQGAEYGRAFVASGVAAGDDRKPGRTASELAASIAADQYSDGHRTAAVHVARAEPKQVGDVTGVLVRAEATLSAPADGCVGSRGAVSVVAVPTRAGTSVFVVGADTVAGPGQPELLISPDQVTALVDSLRVMS